MQRRAFLAVSIASVAAAGVPLLRGQREAQGAPGAALRAQPERLVPCLPLTVVVATDAPPGVLHLELCDAAGRVATWPFAAAPGARLQLRTPAPPDGTMSGRFMVHATWIAGGREVCRVCVGGYELVPLRFSA